MTNKDAIADEEGKLNNLALEPNYIQEEPRVGFTTYAERLNGRLAMIGFASLLGLQVLAKHGFLG
ncbi:MAG TPA: high light inducible protein [Kamptonema sp.]|nr:high light inducible protein [Kamptonema sp.]